MTKQNKTELQQIMYKIAMLEGHKKRLLEEVRDIDVNVSSCVKRRLELLSERGEEVL